MNAPVAHKVSFSEKLQVLFQPKRFKVFWGGRDAGRSWGCARALLLLGTGKPIRVLCARELQNSLADSVHKLLSDQITALGLAHFYKIEVGKITGVNGTHFSFEGIKNNTTKIKSYEGIDYCWVEEANKVSKASWGHLIPTIRKLGSEIWLTFNPELESDYTYQAFVVSPPTDSIVVHMTYLDNPWHSTALDQGIEDMKKSDYDSYLNVWMGLPLQMLEGVVYAKELRRAEAESRIGTVPWLQDHDVDTFWDLGRRDQTSIWFSQRVGMELRVLDFYQARGEEITHFLKELQNKPYTYGTHHLPHDAKAKRLGSKLTIEEMVRQGGKRQVAIVPKLSISDGLNAGRLAINQAFFDKSRCADGLYALRRYAYKVEDGQYSKEPKHDEHSDAADAWRYLAIMQKTGPSQKSRAAGVLERLFSKSQTPVYAGGDSHQGGSSSWMR